MTDRQFIFPISTGRSGTAYLTDLLRLNLPQDAQVHHERTGFTAMGIDSPDASHFMRFNSIGVDPRVKAFWTQKNRRILNTKVPVYAEISHLLIKAGLIENVDALAQAGRVDLIILTRDTFKILWSFVNRFDFANSGFTWLFYLDPRYPNLILDPKVFTPHGVPGHALWYIHEMWTRAAYYRLLLAGRPNIRLHTVDLSQITRPEGAAALLNDLGHPVTKLTLPPRVNANKAEHFGKDMQTKCDALVRKFQIAHDRLAREYFDAGRRLDLGPRRRLSAPPDTRVH